MTAAGLPSGDQGGSSLSIGSVLDTLRADFPEITISKIRFLESEGLISPARTPAGYRQFSHSDVARLRFVLSAQRDHYLPLKVIRAKLDEFDRNPTDGGPVLEGEGAPGGVAGASALLAPSPAGPVSGGPGGPGGSGSGGGTVVAGRPATPGGGGPGGPGGPQGPGGPGGPTTPGRRSLAAVADAVEVVVHDGPTDDATDPEGAAATGTVARETLLAEDGVDAALLDALEHHGVLRADPDGRYEPEAPVVARTAGALARLGVEPRLLRGARASADREVGLLTQLVTPVARSRGPEAARRAEELSHELATLSGRLHALLVGAGLRGGLRR